jgi:hypothetical protein
MSDTFIVLPVTKNDRYNEAAEYFAEKLELKNKSDLLKKNPKLN